MNMFRLHKNFLTTTIPITNWKLCTLRLMNNCYFPWIILIPRQANLRQIHQLSESNQIQLTKEVNQASKIITKLFKPDNLNVGKVGNIIPQLHIHVIARFKGDVAWPHPVWGKQTKPYSKKAVTALIKKIKQTTV